MPNQDTLLTPQTMQNRGFDETFNVPTIELLGYDPVANALRRVVVNESGNLNTGAGSNMQSRIDYDGRSDDNPVYVGTAARGVATSGQWLISKMTYDGSNRVTAVQTAIGTWDGRASLTYS